MDLSGALRRQWIVVVAGLLVALGLGYGATSAVGVSYESKAMVVLLPPSASVPKGGNPYLNLANMQPVVGVLSDALGGNQTGELVKSISPTATYSAAADPSTSGSVIVLDVKDKTATGVQKVLDALVREVPRQLDQLQSATDTAKPGLITTDLVAKDLKPTVSTKSQVRAALVALALGLALTVAGASFIDGYRARRLARGPRESRRHGTGDIPLSPTFGGPAEKPQRTVVSPARRSNRVPATEPRTSSPEADELTVVGGPLPTGRRS